MLEWIRIPLDYVPWRGGADDVTRSSELPLQASNVMRGPSNPQRQAHFANLIQTVAWHLGSQRVPVNLDFNGECRQLDGSCIAQGVADGLLSPPDIGPEGLVDHVELATAPLIEATSAVLWKEYMREEIPPLFGLSFNQGAWNQGFLVQGDDAFALVTLDKTGLNEDHAYDDGFLSADQFQWQSQNRTTQVSPHGRIISGQDTSRQLHLFVRDRKIRNGKAAPFAYCGTPTFDSWHGEQPITVKFRLDNPLPEPLQARFGVKP